jgi:hypothetical protein
MIVRISCDFRAIFVPFGMLGKPYNLAYENTSLSARISREIGVKMEVARFREIENRYLKEINKIERIK